MCACARVRAPLSVREGARGAPGTAVPWLPEFEANGSLMPRGIVTSSASAGSHPAGGPRAGHLTCIPQLPLRCILPGNQSMALLEHFPFRTKGFLSFFFFFPFPSTIGRFLK